MHTELNDHEMLRYNRQIVLRGFDFARQEKLKASKALVVGLGGLGCAAAPYLASAGIGHLTLLDFDTVSLCNLQRQTLYTDMDIGQLKAHCAHRRLQALNPCVSFQALVAKPDDIAMAQLIAGHQVVVDCTDNVSTREQINHLCFRQKIPLVSAAAIRMEGQISVFDWQENAPCYRCISRLFGDDTLSCVEAGVMAPLVGVMGSLQAMEAIRLLTHYGVSTPGKLLMYDAMTLQFRDLTVLKDPGCDVCSNSHGA